MTKLTEADLMRLGVDATGRPTEPLTTKELAELTGLTPALIHNWSTSRGGRKRLFSPAIRRQTTSGTEFPVRSVCIAVIVAKEHQEREGVFFNLSEIVNLVCGLGTTEDLQIEAAKILKPESVTSTEPPRKIRDERQERWLKKLAGRH